MTLAYCTCGHAQILHFGPYGPCHDRVPATNADEKPRRCACEKFEPSEATLRDQRADLA